MQTTSQKIAAQVKDRRILLSSADPHWAYWRTYVVVIVWALVFSYISRPKDSSIFSLFDFGVLMIALTAVSDTKRSLQRRLDAIVRRLEEKDLL